MLKHELLLYIYIYICIYNVDEHSKEGSKEEGIAALLAIHTTCSHGV